MSSVTEYSKILINSEYGRHLLLQPKSWSNATRAESLEVMDLVMTGKYVMAQVAIPKHLWEGSTKEDI